MGSSHSHICSPPAHSQHGRQTCSDFPSHSEQILTLTIPRVPYTVWTPVTFLTSAPLWSLTYQACSLFWAFALTPSLLHTLHPPTPPPICGAHSRFSSKLRPRFHLLSKACLDHLFKTATSILPRTPLDPSQPLVFSVALFTPECNKYFTCICLM